MNTNTLPACGPEKPEQEMKISFLNKLFTCVAIFAPPAGCAVAIIHWWGQNVTAFYLILTGILFLITGFGITVGYHRLFTHRSFEAKPLLKIALGIAGSMALEGTVFEWCSRHKHHHENSDTDDDPHSPYWSGGIIRGFIHAHVGWIFKARPANPEFCRKYIPHLLNDRQMVFVDRYFPLWAALTVITPMAAGALWEMSWRGAWMGFLWGGLVRIFLVHHITWSINSFSHIFGTREYNTGDMSTNNLLFGIVGLGEGYHNNHHKFPYSAKHGLKWWQFDSSFMAIKLLEKLGMVSNVLVPKKAEISGKRLP